MGKSFTFLLILCFHAFCIGNLYAQSLPDTRVSSSETALQNLQDVEKLPQKMFADQSTHKTDAFSVKQTSEQKNPEQKTDGELIEKENESSHRTYESTLKNFDSPFYPIGEWTEKQFDFEGSTSKAVKIFAFDKLNPNDESTDDAQNGKEQGFQWRSAIGQSLMFLAVQHGYAIGAQQKTRDALKGKFWKDYAKSVKSLHGWDDGGKFFTNYIAHPMQGSLTGFVYVQNSPKEKKLEFGKSSDYWRSRMKAMLWTTAWSTQFEIGLISQAAIGNVGLKGKQTWEDIIVTPTLGTAMLVGEDAVDRFITKKIERQTKNLYVKIFARMLLSPTRNFSNLLRFKEPWYRDRPAAR